MKKIIILITATLFSQTALAKKFALVVGGATEKSTVGAKRQSQTGPADKRLSHEFGQSTARVAHGLKQSGYEVTTLFDSAGLAPAPGSPIGVKQDILDEDFGKLRSLGAQSATSSSIVNALRAIADRANPGDEFEFTLFAHGYRSCRREDGSMDLGLDGISIEANRRSNSNSNCEHLISLTNPETGAIEKVPTSILRDALKAIDAKGVKTNLNLASCHSGETQDLFTAEDFPNTCVAYLASANNVGFGCFPGDAPDDLSYTSTIDMVMAASYMNFADQMMQDEYFKKDDCLQKIAGHYRSKRVEPAASRYDLFMNARKNDRMPHEPTISTQTRFEYFTEGRFNSAARRLVKGSGGEFCFAPIQRDILDFLEFGGNAVTALGRASIERHLQKMQTDMDAYNQSIRAQKEIQARIDSKPTVTQGASAEDISGINFDFAGQTGSAKPEAIALSPDAATIPQGQAEQPRPAAIDPALLAELANAQKRTMELANIVMDSERAIVNIMDQQVLRGRIPQEDPCMRPDARPRTAAAQ